MTRILDTSGVVWCVKDVTAAGVLVDANDYFKAFYEAALTARRSILLSGWQFDSDVELLRGKDAEHLGVDDELTLDDARVAALDARAKGHDGRLRLHPSPTPGELTILDVIDPQALPFDPHAIEEDDEESRSLFTRGIGALFRVFSDRDDRK